MKTFSIKEAIKTNWEVVKANFWFVVGTTFVYFLFNSSFEIGGEDAESAFSKVTLVALIVLGIIFWVVGTIVQMGYTKIYLKLHGGERSKFKELFTYYHLFWRYVGAMILYCLRVFLGFILLVVPGVIWGIKFQFMPILVLDKGMGPVEAMRESGKMTEGHKWHLLKFGLVVAGINIIGFLCFVVGLLVTVPLTVLAHIHIYRKLSA
jgi:uncharacterized membrane protein